MMALRAVRPAAASAAPSPSPPISPGSNENGVSGRGVPDVAGDADPESGYVVRVDGHEAVFGGTSAVAPLWAALIARINQLKGCAAGLHQSEALRQFGGASTISRKAITAPSARRPDGTLARGSARPMGSARNCNLAFSTGLAFRFRLR